jgi:ribose transport system substrate-binding protein
MLNQGVDILAVGVLDQAAVVPPLIEVNKKKVPLVLALTAMEDPAVEYQGFCGADGYRGSYMAGAYLADHLGGEGDVASMEFAFDVWHNRMRNKGFEDAAKAGGLNVAARGQAAANDDADTTFQNVLTGNPNLTGGFGVWDGVGLGMAQAAIGQGRDDVAIVTHDITTPTALQIRDGGAIKATAVALLDEMGTLCGQSALKALAGTDMTRTAALAPEELATPENIEELHQRFIGKSIDESK